MTDTLEKDDSEEVGSSRELSVRTVGKLSGLREDEEIRSGEVKTSVNSTVGEVIVGVGVSSF
jgi:hypothetical protein